MDDVTLQSPFYPTVSSEIEGRSPGGPVDGEGERRKVVPKTTPRRGGGSGTTATPTEIRIAPDISVTGRDVGETPNLFHRLERSMTLLGSAAGADALQPVESQQPDDSKEAEGDVGDDKAKESAEKGPR
uniref:Uncharacterized protein n=1 Tax=Steinernema glaseri TaxID=37863 RepID=A0A1I7ZVD3_9BILA